MKKVEFLSDAKSPLIKYKVNDYKGSANDTPLATKINKTVQKENRELPLYSPTVNSKAKKSEWGDNRVIKSIGWYDIEGELAAEQYPADFVNLYFYRRKRRIQKRTMWMN